MNSLIGTTDFEKDLKQILEKYPEIVKTFPTLLAVRDNKLEIMDIAKQSNLDYFSLDFKTKNTLNSDEIKKYTYFLTKTKLVDLFYNKKIKNLVDYVYGVEVGLDSNGRKNRGGTIMEDLVEKYITTNIQKNGKFEYIPQATAQKIKLKWNVQIKINKSERRFDFAIFNLTNKKLYLVETNFFNGGGSKLKAVCGEFKSLFNELNKQNIELIWITDGKGWISTKKPLEETFNNNNYVFNLEQMQTCLLEVIR